MANLIEEFEDRFKVIWESYIKKVPADNTEDKKTIAEIFFIEGGTHATVISNRKLLDFHKFLKEELTKRG